MATYRNGLTNEITYFIAEDEDERTAQEFIEKHRPQPRQPLDNLLDFFQPILATESPNQTSVPAQK